MAERTLKQFYAHGLTVQIIQNAEEYSSCTM